LAATCRTGTSRSWALRDEGTRQTNSRLWGIVAEACDEPDKESQMLMSARLKSLGHYLFRPYHSLNLVCGYTIS
jgi:hypothetical protein